LTAVTADGSNLPALAKYQVYHWCSVSTKELAANERG
jgi:hypothetical protein